MQKNGLILFVNPILFALKKNDNEQIKNRCKPRVVKKTMFYQFHVFGEFNVDCDQGADFDKDHPDDDFYGIPDDEDDN